MSETPPYTLTSRILDLVAQISEALGERAWQLQRAPVILRRANRIRSIRGTLAIEGNHLTEGEISTILQGKWVAAPSRALQEVQNAIQAYERLLSWDPTSREDLLNAHAILMASLMDVPGHYRRGGVGVMGSQGRPIHIAPPARRVDALMDNLQVWLKETDAHPLIKSCVFHFEFEFIHPFEDGNGRLGRLWQTLILSQWRPLFADLPVEGMIHSHQAEYYDALKASGQAGESTAFIIYMLEIILKTLGEIPPLPAPLPEEVRESVAPTWRPLTSQDWTVHAQPWPEEVSDASPSPDVRSKCHGLSADDADSVARLLPHLSTGPKSATQLMAALGLKHRGSFRQRYLLPALAAGLIEMTRPNAPRAKNQRYRRVDGGRLSESERHTQGDISSPDLLEPIDI